MAGHVDTNCKVRERPILFSGEMVRAILDGKKTQTRRPIRIDDSPVFGDASVDFERWRGTARGIPTNAQNVRMCGPYLKCDAPPGSDTVSSRVLCPYGEPGDRLYVKEAWRAPVNLDDKSPKQIGEKALEAYETPWCPVQYEADGVRDNWDRAMWPEPGRYRHARFMPRWASRITLEVTGVRVERLYDISDDDILAEGVTREVVAEMIGWGNIATNHAWPLAWMHIYGAESWEANPWLWVIEFRRVEVAR